MSSPAVSPQSPKNDGVPLAWSASAGTGTHAPDPFALTRHFPLWQVLGIWGGAALVAWLLLKLLASVLTPFVVALVLAYSLSPVVDRLCQRLPKIPRALWVLGVELLFLLIIAAVLLLVVPILSKELPLIAGRLPLLAQRFNEDASPWLLKLGVSYQLDPVEIRAVVLQYIVNNRADLWAYALPSLKVGGSVFLTLVGYAVLIPVATFYLLNDWPRLLLAFDRIIPRRRVHAVNRFMQDASAVLGQYMRGQLSVMLLLAVFYSAGLWLWGLELAIPIGVFTGLAMCIPYAGFGVGLVLALLAGFLQFDLSQTALMLITVYGAGQVLEGFYLTPRLVGKRVGLHPLAVIFALLAFGQLFGFIGVLIALPASSVLLVALRRARAQYLASALYSSV